MGSSPLQLSLSAGSIHPYCSCPPQKKKQRNHQSALDAENTDLFFFSPGHYQPTRNQTAARNQGRKKKKTKLYINTVQSPLPPPGGFSHFGFFLLHYSSAPYLRHHQAITMPWILNTRESKYDSKKLGRTNAYHFHERQYRT